MKNVNQVERFEGYMPIATTETGPQATELSNIE
jgi:hypothetical protein